jgi:SH3-like domain-containing protein
MKRQNYHEPNTDARFGTGIRAARRTTAVLMAMVAVAVLLAFSSRTVSGLQIQPSLTPTFTPFMQLNLPTPTNTPIGGPTGAPTRTPSLAPVFAEAIGEANLRTGPGLDFDVVGTLLAGNPVPVIGRSVRFPWYVVEWEDAPGGEAWVFDQLVSITGDITTVPVVEEPAAPTIDPTTAAILATATILLQTPGAAETATATAQMVPTGVYTMTPGGPGGVARLATFTEPPPYSQPTMLPPATAQNTRGALPPAVFIISLGILGILSLILTLLRRV